VVNASLEGVGGAGLWVMMSLTGGASPSTLAVAVRLSVSRLGAKAWWAAWETRAGQRFTSPKPVAARECTGADRARAAASSQMKVPVSLLKRPPSLNPRATAHFIGAC